MTRDFETKFTGWSFVLAAILLLFGWVLSPHHIGEYIVAEDFAKVGENVWFWIWMPSRRLISIIMVPGELVKPQGSRRPK